MSATTPSPGEIRDYLLRRLTESRRARLEELYFRDDRLLDRVEEAEDQLVSDYVLGRLSPADRKIFEDSLLATPYYRDRIESTTQMRLRLSRHKAFLKSARVSEPRLLPRRTGFLVAISLLAILFVAALASALRLKSDLERATKSLAASVGPDLAGRVLVLPEGGGSATAPLRILRPGAGTLLLVLPRGVLPDVGPVWRLTLQGRTGTVWESGPVRAGAPGEGDVALRLPAGVPAPGRYEVIATPEGDPAAGRAIATLEIVEPGR